MSKTLKLSVIAIMAIILLLLGTNSVKAAHDYDDKITVVFSGTDGASGTVAYKTTKGEKTSYNLTGSLTSKGEFGIDEGQDLALTITPNTNCYLKSIKVVRDSNHETKDEVTYTSVGVKTYSMSNVKHTYTITATFAKNPVITIKTIDITDENKETTETVTVPYNTVPESKTIAAPEGYDLIEADVSDLKNLGKVTANTTVNVKIAKRPTVSVTAKDTEGNVVEVKDAEGNVVEPAVIAYNGSYSKTVVIPENYRLKVDGSNVISLTEVKKDTDIVIEVIELHEVSTKVVAGKGLITETKILDHGTTGYTIQILPKTGYLFKTLTLDGVEVKAEPDYLGQYIYTIPEEVEKDYVFEVYFEKQVFDLNVYSDEGTNLDPHKVLFIEYGDDATLTIKALPGYVLSSVTVENKEQALPLLNDELVLKEIKADTTVIVKVEKETYEVVEGADQTFDEESNLVVRFSGDLKLLAKVYVNGKELDAANYELSEGSTIVTLKKEYLAALDNGTYTLKVEYQNGNSAETTFVIDNEETENPKTGDIVTIVIIALVVSALGMAVTFKRK